MVAGWGRLGHHSAGRQTKGSQELLPYAKVYVLVVKQGEMPQKTREKE